MGRAKVRSGTELDIHMFLGSYVLGRWERGEHQNYVSGPFMGSSIFAGRVFVHMSPSLKGSTWRLRYLGIDIYLESQSSFGVFSST